MNERVIALVDMDCFYVQVEERIQPEFKGTPAAVVQYRTYKGGGIIAVNYEARACGIKRGMMGDDAKELCSNIHLFRVPVAREKADLTKYRDAGKEVISVLCEFSNCVEKASVDEAYIDLTEGVVSKLRELLRDAESNEKFSLCDTLIGDLPSTWIVDDEENSAKDARLIGLVRRLEGIEESLKECGPSSDLVAELKLIIGAVTCEKMRAAILEKTGFKCSAGISHNKTLSKFACGLHKPNQQTVLPITSVPRLWHQTPVGKVRNLGGKLGISVVEDLKCKTMGDLAQISISQLKERFDHKTGNWLFLLGQGIEKEPVISRQHSKSVGCGKNFNGKEGLDTKEKVLKWVGNLSEELTERLNDDQKSNKRMARSISVGIKLDNSQLSRSCPLKSYNQKQIARTIFEIVLQHKSTPATDDKWEPIIRNLSLSAGKFMDSGPVSSVTIESMFKKAVKKGVPKAKNNACASERVGCITELKENQDTTDNNESDTENENLDLLLRHIDDDDHDYGYEVELCEQKEKTVLYESQDLFSDWPQSLDEATNNGINNVGKSVSSRHTKFLSHTHSTIDKINDECSNIKNERHDAGGTNIVLCTNSPDIIRTQISSGNNIHKKDTSNDDNFNNCHTENNFPLDDNDSLSEQNLENDNECPPSPKLKSFFKKFLHDKSKPKTSSNLSNDRPESLFPRSVHENSGVDMKIVDHEEGKQEIENFSYHANTSGITNVIANSNSSCDTIQETETSVRLEEIFPDIYNIDESIIPLLPENLQRQAYMLSTSKGKQNQNSKSNKYKSVEPKESFCQNSFGMKDDRGGESGLVIDKIESSDSILMDLKGPLREPFLNCEKCGRKIPHFKYDEHLDYHLAVQIRQDQFKEAKDELKSSPTKGKRKKGSTSNEKATKHLKLDTYFSRK